jgi:hypothetical protein
MNTDRPNTNDHRFSYGDKVEYGFSSPHGGDRLGTVLREWREGGQDGYLITPLSITPGDGTAPSVYPAYMVYPWTPARWEYDLPRNTYIRTYSEIKREHTYSASCNCRPCLAVRRGISEYHQTREYLRDHVTGSYTDKPDPRTGSDDTWDG